MESRTDDEGKRKENGRRDRRLSQEPKRKITTDRTDWGSGKGPKQYI